MSSLTPTGSATGNARNKVALAPGRSLMDWVRLCNSGKDLSGNNGVFTNITSEELAKHNKLSDAWLAIRGIVYNITEYMSFHPGGEDELMKGIGTDATKLFNKVHPWVNYESLLKSCIVGRLISVGSSTTQSSRINNIEKFAFHSLNSNETEVSIDTTVSSYRSTYKMNWFQQVGSLTLIFYLKSSNNDKCALLQQIFVSLADDKLLSINIGNEIYVYELSEDVRWPCNLKVCQSTVEIKLMKVVPMLWTTYGNQLDSNNVQRTEFCQMKVKKNSYTSHDTKFIILEYDEKLLHYFHVGHHVLLKIIINDEEIIRPYTPVTHLIQNSDSSEQRVSFLIKKYNNGKLSSKICSLSVGDTIQMSIPRGTFNCMILRKKVELILFAAGTGITPMTSIIVWSLNNTKLKVKLMYFNKTESDIIWKDQISKLAVQNLRFDVTYVLSQPSSSWEGEKGFISEKLVRMFLEKSAIECFVCICGPAEFNKACNNYVESYGYSEDNIYCFSG